ncbi:hypothetical protein ABK046_51825, partial [Streptomyces caeruleatus]
TDVTSATGATAREKLLNAINAKIGPDGATANFDSSNKLVITKNDGGALAVTVAALTGTGPALGTPVATGAYALADIGFG